MLGGRVGLVLGIDEVGMATADKGRGLGSTYTVREEGLHGSQAQR